MKNTVNEALLAKECEYRDFLIDYLLPLLGVNNGALQQQKHPQEAENKGEYIYQRDKRVFFTDSKFVKFSLDTDFELSEDCIKVACAIVRWFTKVSQYDISSGECKLNYESDILRHNNYRFAIQNGICEWIGGASNKSVEKLFDVLENWSVKTYEGKPVSFGFIINPCAKSSFDCTFGDWCEFLKDDFCAVLTDCENSVIELDGECNFCNYISITEGDRLKESELKYDIPYRFTGIVSEHVKGEAVGVFLLANGDIILSKNGKVLFVKRNLKWLNFSYDAFEKVIYSSLGEGYVDKALLRAAFASTLDVSFSNAGGIIAIINNEEELTRMQEGRTSVINQSDYLMSSVTLAELKRNLVDCGLSDAEAAHRVLKRNVILSLTKEREFVKIDRKLRCELISLDGACVINTQGRACSFGAIIKNDSGSSEGGRGAAAKKLSYYGFAIKISTDGYIELYINGDIKYEIK